MKRRSHRWLLATVALCIVFSTLTADAAGRRHARRARRAARCHTCQTCPTHVVYSTPTVVGSVDCHMKALPIGPSIPSDEPLQKLPGASLLDDMEPMEEYAPEAPLPTPAEEPSPSDLPPEASTTPAPRRTPATPPAPPAPPTAEEEAPAQPAALDSPFDAPAEEAAPAAEDEDVGFEDLFEGLPNEPAEAAE